MVLTKSFCTWSILDLDGEIKGFNLGCVTEGITATGIVMVNISI
jgi:hypothetical protein